MPLINFKAEFTNKILSGEKRITIRSLRKRPFELGDRLFLYTGIRTKMAKKIATKICIKISYILINSDQNIFLKPVSYLQAGSSNNIIMSIYDNKKYVPHQNDTLTKQAIENLAKLDGFSSSQEMINFFKDIHGLPFYGQVIHW